MLYEVITDTGCLQPGIRSLPLGSAFAQPGRKSVQPAFQRQVDDFQSTYPDAKVQPRYREARESYNFV